jgi:hypothetical protein
MTSTSNYPPNFPKLIENQPITYFNGSEYKIVFFKKPHSILDADIHILLITEYGLKSQIYQIIKRIINECYHLNLRSEHALNAQFHITPPITKTLTTLLEEVVTVLSKNYCNFHWSCQLDKISYTPRPEAFTPNPYFTSPDVYKY